MIFRIISLAVAGTSLVLTLLAVPALFVDPVYTGFLLGLAIVLGGLSSLGRGSILTLSICSILFPVVLVLFFAHYSTGQGFMRPDISSLTSVGLLLAGPLIVAGALFGLGSFLRCRRRRTASAVSGDG